MQQEGERKDATEGSADEAKSRPQRGGEGGTSRFGMEDGDNTDVPATGGPTPD